MVMLPKTVNPHRMTENADLERFNILVEDMIALDALDEHLVTDWQGPDGSSVDVGDQLGSKSGSD
ncbi:hypothetical protein ACO1O0_006820 [Amphichorda felina]